MSTVQNQARFACVMGGWLLISSIGLTWGQALDAPAPAPPPAPPPPSFDAIQPPLVLTNRPRVKPPMPPNVVRSTGRKFEIVPSRPLVRPTQATQTVKPAPLAPRTVPPVTTTAPFRAPAVQTRYTPTPPNALAWDKEFKEMTVESGATNALISFNFTNVCSSNVVIQSVRTSCGCTTVKLPPMPWRIPPGSNGLIQATLDLRGRRGVQTKSLMVNSSSGFKSLLFKVVIPPQIVTTSATGQPLDPERIKNMRVAATDRQAVFKNQDCVKCHLEPAQGKMGKELYTAACGMCHDSDQRASMVPSLAELRIPTSAPYWKYWVVNGRPGSMMPAFAQALGGPLTTEQIDSLVSFLTENFTRKPSSVSALPAQRPPSPTAPKTVPARTPPIKVTSPPVAPAPAPSITK